MESAIERGEIIYHPEYGFGVMNELPTFGGMSVAGISGQCLNAHKFVMEYAKKVAIDFCLDVCGELKFLNDKTSYDEKSNECFLMTLPATVDKRFDLYLESKQKL